MSIIQAIIGTNLTISSGTPAPAYSVSGYNVTMTEGNTNTATLTYSDVPPSTTIFWTIVDGTTANVDWVGNTTPGNSFVISGTGTTTFSWQTRADITTEGQESYILNVGTSLGNTDIFTGNLYIADTSAFVYQNFTIEWWDKLEGGGDLYPRPWAIGEWVTSSNNHSIAISYEGGQDIFWLGNTIIGQSAQNRSGQGWRHNAFVRNNNVIKGYVNGVEYFSSNNGNIALNDNTKPLYVGYGGTNGYFKGYLKDLHIIKNTAKYTTNFSPPASPITAQAESVFLLPVSSNITLFDDNVGLKTATLTNTPTYSEDDPWTWPSQTFTAYAYGGVNIALNSPYLTQSPVIGLKVSDSSGWSDYIYSTDLLNHVTFYNNAPVRAAGEIYTIGEENNPITLNINYTSGNNVEGRLSQYPALSPLLAVKAGWTYSGPGGNTGTVPGDAYIVDPNGLAQVRLTIPTGASLGSWTFTPPTNRGGSLYFVGNSYINYGSSSDWAMDA